MPSTLAPDRPRARRLHRGLTASAVLLGSLVFVAPVTRLFAEPPRATVTGVVFEDRNGNGLRDRREDGIAGVSVSDGVTFATTDAVGAYQLTIDPQRRITDLVFISQPSGYRLPTDEYKTPRFYRDLGQLADGAAATADFGMARDPESLRADFSFANVADPHVNPQLPGQLEEINSTGTDLGFIQVSGDLTNNATDAEFQQYRASTAASTLPVWPAVGNHEYYQGGGTSYAARIDNYRRYVGPEWYSFSYGNRHFLVLENNGQAPIAEELEWARQDLAVNAVGKRVVVLMHQPMNVPFGSPSEYDQFGDLLEQYETELVLVGHEHSNDVENDSAWVDGAKHIQTNSSSYTIDNSPRGFRYVHMRSDRFDNPFRMYGVDRSLTITSPAPDATVPRAMSTGVQVNAYDTANEVVKVRYSLDGGDWRPLQATGDFTWFAPWPGRTPRAGQHTVKVKVTDQAGTSLEETSEFTLTDEPAVPPVPGGAWEQLHGDPAHSGIAADAPGAGLQLAWTYRTPGTFLTGSPVIVDGVVYAGTRDENGDGNSALHAVDLATGRQLWSFPTASSVHGTPAVRDGVVFVPSLRGTLYAVDAASGQLLWQRDPEPGPDPLNQRSYSYYSPAVADGLVYWAYQTRYGPASQGLLTALDPATGATVWQAPMTGATMSDGAPTVADGRVFVGNQTADRVIAYDAATGARLWVGTHVLGGWQDGNPAAGGGRVFIGANNGLIARDAATGQNLWTYRSPFPSHISSGSTPSTPAVADDTVYMGFPDGNVVALDASTGMVRWSQLLPGELYLGGVHSSPVVSGDTVYVGANNGWFYALDRATGQPLWQYEIGAWVAAGPAVSGNAVVAGAWDGNLYAFTPGGTTAVPWGRITGTVVGTDGAPVASAKVVLTKDGTAKETSTDTEGRFVIGLEPGTYTVSTSKRGYLPTDGSQATVEVGDTGEVPVELLLDHVTGPVAGVTTVPPDLGSGSTRVDVVPGDSYHYVMNDRVQATVVSRTAANNQPGTFQPGWLGDLALLDANALETIDWSELILAPTMNDPARPWNRSGEWLSLPDISVDEASVVASGSAQVDPALQTSLRYQTLAGAPVVKMTLQITNTAAADFAGYFQYLLDPDSTQDIALVPGVSGENRGFLTSGWTGNYLYVGPRSQVASPAQAIAWVDDQPTGVTAFGYIGGVWFDASVAAGETRTITWYHITDYPAAGTAAANIANWAAQLPTLDPDVADRAQVAGTVTATDTGQPLAGVPVRALAADGMAVSDAFTGGDGRFALAIEPGSYTIEVTTLGYDVATVPVEVTEGATTTADVALVPVTAAASTGKRLLGGLIEGGTSDVVLENDQLAMAVSRVFDDPQLAGSTVGKPIDLAARGRQDQIDWINLPYIATAQPTGTEAWQQRTVAVTSVDIVEAGGQQAVVRATGTASSLPDVGVVTTYTARPGEQWITAETVFTNNGASALPVWVGDAIDHDGSGQRSGVAGVGSITTPYAEPAAYTPTGPWIGMTGTDTQTYGLIYGAGNGTFSAYGNGNWIMSQHQVEIPAGGQYTLSRRIVVAPNGGAADPFAVLDQLAG